MGFRSTFALFALLLLLSIPKTVTAQVTCEAASGRLCYYLDPSSGDDNYNTGSFSSPWRSFRNFTSYSDTSLRPSRWVLLQAGDVVYFKSGIYSAPIHAGLGTNGSVSPDGGPYVVYLRNVHGSAGAPITLKAYPGHTAIIDPNKQGWGLTLLQSDGLVVSGLEIRNSFQRGISIAESSNILLSALHVHDTDGVDNNNLSGIYLDNSYSIELAQSSVHDNFDRTNADTNGTATENSADMTIFQGGNINVHDTRFFQTPAVTAPKTGACLKYKHASPDPSAVFEVHHNIFENCAFYALGTGTANTRFHHNVVIGGYGVQSRDLGGVTHQTNQIVEYNTFYFTIAPFYISSLTTDWRNSSFPNDPQNIRFENNIVIDGADSHHQEQATINVAPYSSDAMLNVALPQLYSGNNCYSDEFIAPAFAIGASNGTAGSSYSSTGGIYSLSQFKINYGYESGSVIARPIFTNAVAGDFHLSAQSPCGTAGAYPAGTAGGTAPATTIPSAPPREPVAAPAPTPTPTPTPVVTPVTQPKSAPAPVYKSAPLSKFFKKAARRR